MNCVHKVGLRSQSRFAFTKSVCVHKVGLRSQSRFAFTKSVCVHKVGLRSQSRFAALQLVHSYLNNRWHRTKINNTFSTWKELLTGVPQGSILGPLLFDIYIIDLFFEKVDVCNYADDTGLHVCDKDLPNLLYFLEHDTHIVIEWFESNYMKLNKDKCDFLISGKIS